MEKLNRGNRSYNSEPYNDIYTSYISLFDSLFQSRLIGDSDIYVRMKEKENEILEYINSGAKSVCLLTGLTGIGKSSLLNYISSLLSKENESHCIFIDLLGRRAKLGLGEDFHNLDEKTARIRAESVAEPYIINSVLGSFTKKNITSIRWGGYFYDYMIDHDMGNLIFPLSMHDGNDEQSKIDTVNAFKIDNPLGHAYAALKYYCFCLKKKKLIIILDNTDQKDYELIEAFVDILSDFTRCIGKEIDSVTPIISCRPYNEKRLQKRKDINSLSSHGSKTITIKTPCLISSIIIERHNKIKKQEDRLSFNTKKGVKWKVSDVNEFIRNLTKRYEEEGLDKYVLKLNNYNLSKSLENTLNILKNRYFVFAERLLPSVFKDSKLPYGLSRSAVLKALAYGNPSTHEQLSYPHEGNDMPIPNLLNWNIDQPVTFLSKFRVIQYLIKKKAYIDRKAVYQEKLFISLDKHFGMSVKQSTKCLTIMYYEGLIFTHSNREPREEMNDYIAVSPKALKIFNDCQFDSLYTEFWFDDTPVKPLLFRTVFNCYKFNQKPLQLIKFIRFLWGLEKSQLMNLVKTNTSDSYLHQYSNDIICNKLLIGVERSIYAYYQTISQTTLEGDIHDLKDEMQEMCEKLTPSDLCSSPEIKTNC